jgi:hypothetical protein
MNPFFIKSRTDSTTAQDGKQLLYDKEGDSSQLLLTKLTISFIQVSTTEFDSDAAAIRNDDETTATALLKDSDHTAGDPKALHDTPLKV